MDDGDVVLLSKRFLTTAFDANTHRVLRKAARSVAFHVLDFRVCACLQKKLYNVEISPPRRSHEWGVAARRLLRVDIRSKLNEQRYYCTFFFVTCPKKGSAITIVTTMIDIRPLLHKSVHIFGTPILQRSHQCIVHLLLHLPFLRLPSPRWVLVSNTGSGQVLLILVLLSLSQTPL